MIVIVENDLSSGYGELISRLTEDAPPSWRIRFTLENRLGIPQARNKCLDIALAENSDWIAFIDDDETVASNWLEMMVAAIRDIEADVLTGPVNYIYPDHLPPWLKLKDIKQKQRGAALNTAYTNNTVMRSWVARDDGLGLRFDESMQFTGGSDSDFFYRASDQGASIRWVDDALVSEIVVPVRLTQKWQLGRAMRVAANTSTMQKKRRGGLHIWLRYLPRSVSRMMFGCTMIIVGATLCCFKARTGPELLFAGRKSIASGIGSLLGLMNMPPQPYRDVE